MTLKVHPMSSKYYQIIWKASFILKHFLRHLADRASICIYSLSRNSSSNDLEIQQRSQKMKFNGDVIRKQLNFFLIFHYRVVKIFCKHGISQIYHLSFEKQLEMTLKIPTTKIKSVYGNDIKMQPRNLATFHYAKRPQTTLKRNQRSIKSFHGNAIKEHT